jgi:hypothetical protein
MIMHISLDDAQEMLECARAHAERIGVAMNTAVVDGGGHLIAFARMDRAVHVVDRVRRENTEDLIKRVQETAWMRSVSEAKSRSESGRACQGLGSLGASAWARAEAGSVDRAEGNVYGLLVGVEVEGAVAALVAES